MTPVEHLDQGARIRGSLSLTVAIGVLNLAFWILWPASLLRVRSIGFSDSATGAFGATAWCLTVIALLVTPTIVARRGYLFSGLLSAGCIAIAAAAMMAVAAGWAEWLSTAILGVALGVRWAALDAWLAELAPNDKTGRLIAFSEAVAGACAAIGPSVASFLGGPSSILRLGGASILCAALGAALCLLTPRPTRPGVADTRDHQHAEPFAADASIPLFILCVCAIAGGFFNSGFAGAITLVSGAQGRSADAILFTTTMVGAGGLLLQYPLGHAADFRGGRLTRLILCMCSGGVALAALALLVWPDWINAIGFAIGGLGCGIYTVTIVYAMQRVRATRSAVRIVSTIATAYCIGTLLAPLVTGIALEHLGVTETIMIFAILASVPGSLSIVGWRSTARQSSPDTV